MRSFLCVIEKYSLYSSLSLLQIYIAFFFLFLSEDKWRWWNELREKSMGECKTLGFRLDTGFAYSIRFPVFAVSYDDMAFICTTQTKTSANYNIEKVEDHEVWTFLSRSIHSSLPRLYTDSRNARLSSLGLNIMKCKNCNNQEC